VDALEQIAKTMGAAYWVFNPTSCKLETVGVTSPEPPARSEKNITCNCQFENSTCHVIAMYGSLCFRSYFLFLQRNIRVLIKKFQFAFDFLAFVCWFVFYCLQRNQKVQSARCTST
jgi:hypothetical protein